MSSIAKALMRALPASQNDIEILKTLVMFGGVGVTVSLLLATHGMDLSMAFF
jgi:hypothetical protein